MLFLIPLKTQWDRMGLLEEKKCQKVTEKSGKIGPFKVFALFPLHDNEQRREAIEGPFHLDL